MLQLKNITKDYLSGVNTVHALKGVSIDFNKKEFVSILGHSGCGKTTLLNIIGGLDKYTTGDLIINGISTVDYKDSDWDSYRNHSIGFVFQSYNLISHQTVLKNVELALTISGKSKAEAKQMAIEALKKVGLENEIHKKPNQLSGGQMQRVAIARAIVNDPDILLADEPTGALDSETSELVMEILREIAKTKLVIMVTHNGELADKYSTRIIKLNDGLILSDEIVNKEYYGDSTVEEAPKEQSVRKLTRKEKRKAKTSMSFLTALSLSFSNLLTKKGRTIMTAFAGSIGIIGIALILSMSNGVNEYINRVQEDTLSSYPISIETETMDYSGLLTSMGNIENKGDTFMTDEEKVYSNNTFVDLANTFMSEIESNDLKSFKAYIDQHYDDIKGDLSAIKYSYDVNLNIYANPQSNNMYKVNPSNFMELMFSSLYGGASMGNMSQYTSTYSNMFDSWQEFIDNDDLFDQQYSVLKGRKPKNYDEVVLVVDKDNEVNLMVLYSLGLVSEQEVKDAFSEVLDNREFKAIEKEYSFDEIIGLEYKLILDADHYSFNSTIGKAEDKSTDIEFLKNTNGINLKIVGIVRPQRDAVSVSITNGIGYTHALVNKVIEMTESNQIIRYQTEHTDIDVFTGVEFDVSSLDDIDISIDDIKANAESYGYTSSMIDMGIAMMGGEDKFIEYVKNMLLEEMQSSSYLKNLQKLGNVSLDTPSLIAIYPKDFKSKDNVVAFIDGYNNSVEAEQKIKYTDYVGIIMSSVTNILNAVTYSLIAFVAISLIVSSIMIGVITYISVLERTKEIGILRSIGASKHDISTVFNAETLIIGFTSGLLGILISLLLLIPINLIIKSVSGITHIAILPVWGAIGLVAISALLTFIAGLIPSRFASKRDPVIALRTE